MIMALVCAVQFMVILDAAIVNVALPAIQRELGFTPTGMAWVVNGYLLAFAGLLLLGGRAVDLFGHRRMLVAGLLLFSVSSLVGGLAAAPDVLVAARVAQGVGAAMLAPATLAVINTNFTEEHARARAFGAWSASGGVGGMAGALAGGAITTGLSWRWIFLINVPIGAALIVVAAVALTGRRTGRRAALDLTGAVTGAAGLTALIYGITRSADHDWTAGAVIGPAVAGVILLAVFVSVEAQFATEPMMPLRLFRIRGVAVGNGMLLLFGGIPIAMWYFTSLFLQNVLGYSPLEAGLGQTPAAVTFLVVARCAAALLQHTGSRATAACGLRRTPRRVRLARPGPSRQHLRHRGARSDAAHRDRHRAHLPHAHGRGDRRRPRRRCWNHRRAGQHGHPGRRVREPGGVRGGRGLRSGTGGGREFADRRVRRRLRRGLPGGGRPQRGHRDGQRAATSACRHSRT